MKFSYLRKDDDGHWYLVPEEDVERFDKLMEESYQVDSDSDRFYEVCELISQFPSCENIRDLKIIMNKPRTEMICKGCGCFSSAQYCHHCSTNPLYPKLIAAEQKIAELEKKLAYAGWETNPDRMGK
jgi:hypothetical protein